MVTKTVSIRLRLPRVLLAAALAALSAAAICAAAAASDWQWKPTDGLMQARSGLHTATRLADGRVLVTGGCLIEGAWGADIKAIYNSTPIFLGDGRPWQLGLSMAKPRIGHTATLLEDKRVLVTGGFSASLLPFVIEFLTSCEIFDPNQQNAGWTGDTDLPGVRVLHTATLLTSGPNKGKVLVTGGGKIALFPFDITEPLPTGALLYTPGATKGTWETDGDLSKGRAYHTATLLKDGRRVLVTGGMGTTQDPRTQKLSPVILKSCDLYDPSATPHWQPVAPLNVGRANHSATLLRDGRVLVAAGQADVDGQVVLTTYEIYNPDNNTWDYNEDKVLNVVRPAHTATLLEDGPDKDKVLVVGPGKTCEIYDPVYDSWALQKPTLNFPRNGRHTATMLMDHRVLVVGGQPNACELYGEPPPSGVFRPSPGRPMQAK